MPNLEPIRAYKCTYANCNASFNSVKEMLRHKKHSDEHDYCPKCDEDFNSVDDLAQHKAWRPDNHDKACRICGDEFKTTSGLRRHTNMCHRTNQKVLCIGCGDEFFNATLYIDHLEFGHCSVIKPIQFTGHVLHKHIVFDLLKGGDALDRFLDKVSGFNAAIDDDQEGGVKVDVDLLKAFEESDQAREIPYQAVKPGNTDEEPSEMPAAFEAMSLSGVSESTLRGGSGNDYSSMTVTGTGVSNRPLKAWGGKSSKKLFPDAQPTPPPSDFAVGHQEREIESAYGINILKTRFWDPTSNDWNAERFFNPISKRFSCPFPCEQTFPNNAMLAEHITEEHRLHRINCPHCLKYFGSITSLMRHVETPGSRCQISEARDFNQFIDRITGGFLMVETVTRPEFLHNPSVRIVNPETGKKEEFTPPVVKMLQYRAMTPPDWKPPQQVAAQIGGMPGETFDYNGQSSHW